MTKVDVARLGMFQSAPEEYEASKRARAARCPVTETGAAFHPWDPDYIADPYKFFAQARGKEPVFYSPEMDCWVVLKYDDMIEIFRDPETFSAAMARHPVTPLCPAAAEVRDGLAMKIEPALVDESPETHKDHRRLFGDAFTPKRVAEMEGAIRDIATRFIDKFIDDGEADLVGQMLFELPALAVFLFLGADDKDAVLVKTLGSKRAIVNWGKPDETEQVAMMNDMGKHWDFTKGLVEAALENPGDNYLGDMARLYHADPSLFSVNYMTNVVFVMMFAGHETTTQTAANGLKHLLTNRAEWDAICADSSKIPNAVEEMLRIDPSIFGWRRIATEDTVIGGPSGNETKIQAGDKILMMLGSGNRDDDMFPDGERFDHARANAKRNLAFGHGAHFCMGAPLARLEMKVVFEELTRRLPHMKLVEGQKFEYVPTLIFRGVQKLRVEWDTGKNP